MLFGKHINRYYLKYFLLILLGCISLLLVDYFQLIVPELYRDVITGMNTGKVPVNGTDVPFDMAFLLDHVCRPLIIVILVMVTGRFLWRVCLFGTGTRVERDLRSRMFDHCKDLSHQYYQVNKVGDLMSLFTNDLDTITECFEMGILMTFDAGFLGTISIVKMARMHGWLTLLCMIPMGILLAIAIIIGMRMEKKWDKRQQTYSDISDFVQENFSGLSVIKAFVKEAKELLAFRKLNKKNEDANVDFTKSEALLEALIFLFVESVTGIILGFGGYLVYQGVFNAGQLLEFIGYFSAVVWPFMAVSELIGMRARGKASLKRIGELLEAPIDVKDSESVSTDIQTLKGEIEFRNLTFRYPGADYDALKNISFHVKAGESLGIIGRTGAGKSTIADLILRTFNLPDGTLFLDGMDVNTIPIKTVRENAAYVPQDNFLFSDSIANNIAFASDTDDAALVQSSAILADVDENISEFSEKYQTILGERGVTVSGGQKQRISIARALMKNAPILILDDSVSAVDVSTEKTILANLHKTRKGKTTILIAHRISTVENMDRILLIDNGEVVAVGSHEELMRTCKPYQKMVAAQSMEEEHKEDTENV